MGVFVEIPARRLAGGDTGEFAPRGPQQFRDIDFNLLADLGILQRRQQFRLVDVRETPHSGHFTTSSFTIAASSKEPQEILLMICTALPVSLFKFPIGQWFTRQRECERTWVTRECDKAADVDSRSG